MCDLSAVLADDPQLAESIAVVSCVCGGSRALTPGDRAAAIVLAPGSHDRVSKLLWLVRLRFALWDAKRTLARLGVRRTSALAVWPSLDRSMIVYDIGTSAAAYAESRVLRASHGRLAGLLRLAAGVDMGVDVVVVLGTAAPGAIENERRR